VLTLSGRDWKVCQDFSEGVSIRDNFDHIFFPFVQISLFFPGEGEKLPSLSRTLMAKFAAVYWYNYNIGQNPFDHSSQYYKVNAH
jgi:hypothetical protein